jgi:hypothetical protein
LVGKALFGPTFENTLDTESLDPVELVILEIGVMNELSQPLHCSVSNPESIDQCLEGAIVTVMAEIDIEHVVRDSLGLGRRCVTENEFGFRINESPDEPSRGNTIDFGSCPG